MKVKYTLEYLLNCSPIVLFPRLSTPGGLSEWFADNVNLEGKYFVFYWDDTSNKAEIIQKRENYFIRFKWLDDTENTYFEFRIVLDELTGENSLIVIDFAEENEKKEAIDLWNSQISVLKHCIGA
jgi:hypothetical protein